MVDVNQNTRKKFNEEMKKANTIASKDSSLKFVSDEQKEGHFIQIKKENVLKIGIKDESGNDTGQYLEFDMDDIEMPLKLSKCEYLHKKNLIELNNKFTIINKKEDKKGKFIVSYKEEEKIKALKEYYKKEMEALDLFLGKDGCKKLLNGREPYYNMYEDFGEILNPILPLFEGVKDNIDNLVKEKYSNINAEGIIE